MFRHFMKDSWKGKAIGTQGIKKSNTISKLVLFFHPWGRKKKKT